MKNEEEETMPQNGLDILKPIKAVTRDEEVKRSHISGSQPTDTSQQLPDIPDEPVLTIG